MTFKELKEEDNKYKKIDIEYGIQVPKENIKHEESPTRYLFDVRIEQPVENAPER